jgi:DNA-binding NarL/FixJ family response regulator
MRILLCDDSAELRALLRSAIEHETNPVGAADDVTIVGEVGDGDAALRLAAEHQPDVVVLDLEMPGPAPAPLLRTLRRLAPRAAIVTFSGHDPAVVAGLAAREIALHLPKTTDLAAAGRAVRELGRRSAT